VPLSGYFAIRRGLRELESVKQDRRGVMALLARAREAEAPGDLKAAIVLALARHAGREVIDVLGDVLARDPSWRARAAATVALGGMNDAEARKLLDDAAERDGDRRVRENARFNRSNPGAFTGL